MTRDELIKIVREKYPTIKAQDIADECGVSLRRIYDIAKVIGVKKLPEVLYKQQCEQVSKAGIKTRFKKGQEPWSKGKKLGIRPGMEKSMFKKGHVPDNTMPLGTKMKFDNGYWYEKVNIAGKRQCVMEGARGLKQSGRWRACHYILWEKYNPPLPDGMVLIFKDGNRDNLTIDNLMAVNEKDRAIWSRYNKLGAETFQTITAINQLKREIKKYEEH